MAAESFLEGDDGCQVNMAKKEIKLSQIFKWYKEDFGKNNKEVSEDKSMKEKDKMDVSRFNKPGHMDIEFIFAVIYTVSAPMSASLHISKR